MVACMVFCAGERPSLLWLSLALLLLLLSPPTLCGTHYAIHMTAPLTDPSMDSARLGQWLAAANFATAQVNALWASSTGNSLEILILDNQGNSVVNVENALSSIQNASNVVSLLLALDNPEFVDDIARVSRFFNMPVVSAASRSTRIEASPADSTLLSMATSQEFDATVFGAILANNTWQNYSVLYDGVTSSMNGVLQGLYQLPSRSSASFVLQSNITIDADPSSALQSIVRDSVNVMMIVGSAQTTIQAFADASEVLALGQGRYMLFDGIPVDSIYNLPNGSQVLDVVDANATMRASFLSMMTGQTGFVPQTGLDALAPHTIHVYDAVLAIARAIEVAEASSIPATRASVWQALSNSDYQGFSGDMVKDVQGFRQSGYARILNVHDGNVIIPWTFEQGVATTLAPAVYLGDSYSVPKDQTIKIALAQLTSTLGSASDMRIAIQFAMDLVNANTSVWMPPNNEIFLMPFNDAGSTNQIVQNAIQLQLYGVAGAIGPKTSSLAFAAEGVLGPDSIPTISTSATNGQLSNKALYPSFLRVLQPDSLQGAAILNLCVAFGWSEIAIISSTDSYGSGLAQTISDAATSAGVTVAANVAVDLTSTDITAGIKEIQAAGARILVVVIETDEWATVQTSMQKVGYSPSAVVASDWLLGAGSAYIVEATGYNLSTWNGWISTNPPSGFGAFFDWIYATAQARSAQYPGLMDLFSTAQSQTSLTIDTVFIYADAIRRVVQAGGNPRNPHVLLPALFETNLTLCTGSTAFNENGDRLGPFDILNVQAGQSVLVGKFQTGAPYQSITPVIWPSGDTTVPVDHIPRTKTWLSYGSGAGIAMAVLAAVGLFGVILTFGIFIWQRNSAIIISSTWEFLLVMLVGSAIGYGSIFTWLGEPTKAACSLRIWLPPIAFSLIMAPLLAKTWRLHRIFTLGSLKVTPIRLWKLAVFSSILVLIQVVICIFWLSLGTVEPITVNDPSSSTTAFVLCNQNKSNRIATWVTFGFTGFCLVIGAYYAFRVRNLPKEFNESRWIGFVIYNSILAAVIVIVLGYSLPHAPITVLILICICTFVIATGCVGLMMLPKVWVLVMHPEARSSSTVKTSNTKPASKDGSISKEGQPGDANRRTDFSRYQPHSKSARLESHESSKRSKSSS